jgi:competence protein J (ComJ)
MSNSLKLYVTYQQVSLFDPMLPQPFNSWEDKHVAQGFSWRNGSVAFGTLNPDGEIVIEIAASREIRLSNAVKRAIIVPFEVPENGTLELATITESHQLAPPRNTKGILFEAGVDGRDDMYKITFLVDETPLPRILVADAELSPPTEYLMETVPG